MTLSSTLSPALLLLLLTSPCRLQQAGETTEPVQEEHDNFTPDQLARAKDSLGRLYDEKMDANKDGKVTRAELLKWLAESARQQAEDDLDEAWRGYNLTADGQLDWDTHAQRRADNLAALGIGKTEEQQEEEQKRRQADMQAEVKRAIQEASKEVGLDKAGIKVAVPEMAPETGSKKPDIDKDPRLQDRIIAPDATSHEQEPQHSQDQHLAIELAHDRRRWDAADADGDGKLSRREFADFALAEGSPTETSPKMQKVLAQEALERLDSNGDGRVSEAEFLAGSPTATADDKARADDAENFRKVWDTNKDGYMDADEMEQMLAYLDSASTSGNGKMSTDSSDEDSAALAYGDEADHLMRTSDTDGDGSLSKAEVLEGLRDFAGSAGTGYGDAVGIHDEL